MRKQKRSNERLSDDAIANPISKDPDICAGMHVCVFSPATEKGMNRSARWTFSHKPRHKTTGCEEISEGISEHAAFVQLAQRTPAWARRHFGQILPREGSAALAHETLGQLLASLCCDSLRKDVEHPHPVGKLPQQSAWVGLVGQPARQPARQPGSQATSRHPQAQDTQAPGRAVSQPSRLVSQAA